MRLDVPQVIVQMPNLDRVTSTAGTLISENVQHTQKQREQTRGVEESNTVRQTDEAKAVKKVEDDDKKKKALLTRKRKDEDEKREESEESGEARSGTLIDIKV